MTPSEHEDRFWYFVSERQAIWHRRFIQGLPKPWTNDPILQTNKFTNVYRELDPGTQYVFEGICRGAEPAAVKAFNILFYRVIGRAETHAQVGLVDPTAYSIPEVASAIRNVRHEKGLFTGAYLVHPYHWMGGRDKIENVAMLFGEIAQDWTTTWQQVQALVDMQYPVRVGGAGLLPDRNDDWAKAGPGAIKGLTYLFGDAKHAGDRMKRLRDDQENAFSQRGLVFHHWDPGTGPERVSLANIQNCLCEYHKYAKIQAGTGKARMSYAGA